MTTSAATPGLPVSDELIDYIADRLNERATPKQAFTTKGLAEYFDVTERYVRGWGERGCPYHRIGKRSIWVMDEVLAWLTTR